LILKAQNSNVQAVYKATVSINEQTNGTTTRDKIVSHLYQEIVRENGQHAAADWQI